MKRQRAAGDRFPEEVGGEGFKSFVCGGRAPAGQTGEGEKQSRTQKHREKKNNEEGLFTHPAVSGRPGRGIFSQSGRKDCG